MTLLDGRQSVSYKGNTFSYEDTDKLVIDIDEKDIAGESMSRITLSHCNIFHGFLPSGELRGNNSGYRQIVTDRNFNMYPIIKRRSTGIKSERRDLICYDTKNFIIFKVEWKNSEVKRSILTIPGYQIDESQTWKVLSWKNPILYSFLTPSHMSPNIPAPQLSQEDANKKHKQRFLKKYGPYLRLDKPLISYTSMDVIDLCAIQEIRITNPKDLNRYPVYEITTKHAILKGHGFNNGLFQKMSRHQMEEGRFLFMLITNSCSHKIEAENRKVLTVTTVEETSIGKRQLLFIKFNENVLHRYKRDLLIDKISI